MEDEPVLQAQANQRHPWALWFFANARWIWPLLLISVVVSVSWNDLRSLHFREIRVALRDQDISWLVAAGTLTILNLAVMGLYDVICLRGAPVPGIRRWWFGSLAFAWSNFLTIGPLAGPAIRFWLYRPSGLKFTLLRQAIVSISIGFMAGLGVWLGLSLIPLPEWGPASSLLRTLAAFTLAYLLGMLARKFQAWRGFPVWVRELKVGWPALFVLGILDWLLAFFVFAAVLRAGAIDPGSDSALRLFMLGQGIGLASLVPGGLGSADAFWLSQLNGHAGREGAAMLLYRVLYYLVPWIAATVVLLRRAVHAKVRWGWPARLFVSMLVVAAGCILLVSSATPALAHRMQLMSAAIPIAILETSHLASAVTGLLLLVLARGLAKGYRSAYRTTLGLLLAGALVSVFKGLDYEEAILLTLTAALLWAHSKLFPLPNRAGGNAIAILTPIALAIFVFAAAGMTSYGHHPYSHSLWLTFDYTAGAARYLRALSVLLLIGSAIAAHFLQRIPHHYSAPTEDEISRALDIHRRVGKGTNALMVRNGDKSIHFWEDRGFCLYRTIGSGMFVFSDPSIPPGSERHFLNSVFQKASELDRSLSFYQISAHWIPVLHDFGFSFFKLGEEAIVDLDKFNIQGNKGKAMRNVLNKFRNDGYTFSVLDPEGVRASLAELKAVSDAWLDSKRTREKQFSIGFFDNRYLCSFPCAIVRDKEGKIVAFCNILPGLDKEEFSVDLMRYVPQCPNGVMDLLFLKLFEWGKEQSFRTFNLGMAPLATVGEQKQARLQERAANLIFHYGEQWYNFRGLRQFKEKFAPRWMPRYLASRAPWHAPQDLANVAVLISGGWGRVLFPERTGPGSRRS